MGKIIAFANQKGGVAKSTSVYAVGVALSNEKKKTLLIDIDPQASLTISTGLEPDTLNTSMVDAWEKETDLESCILKLRENLYIVPTTTNLASFEIETVIRHILSNNEDTLSWAFVFKKMVDDVKNDYDYILIDCPPSLSLWTMNALYAADSVIIPVEADYLAYRGVDLITDTIATVQQHNNSLSIMGIIATKYEKRINDDKEVLETLQEDYQILAIIKKMAAVKQTVYDGKTIIDTQPYSEPSFGYKNVAKHIIGVYENE